MAVETETEPQTVGELIRFGRTQRRLTQMELPVDANLSTKHLSFVETGRSRPSRQLLIPLAQHLDLPIVERNRLLLAAGFAPPYLEQPYDGDPELLKPPINMLRLAVFGGFGSEIAAYVAEDCFWDLDAPLKRVGAARHPIPYQKELDARTLPRPAEIVATVRTVVSG